MGSPEGDRRDRVQYCTGMPWAPLPERLGLWKGVRSVLVRHCPSASSVCWAISSVRRSLRTIPVRHHRKSSISVHSPVSVLVAPHHPGAAPSQHPSASERQSDRPLRSIPSGAAPSQRGVRHRPAVGEADRSAPSQSAPSTGWRPATGPLVSLRVFSARHHRSQHRVDATDEFARSFRTIAVSSSPSPWRWSC